MPWKALKCLLPFQAGRVHLWRWEDRQTEEGQASRADPHITGWSLQSAAGFWKCLEEKGKIVLTEQTLWLISMNNGSTRPLKNKSNFCWSALFSGVGEQILPYVEACSQLCVQGERIGRGHISSSAESAYFPHLLPRGCEVRRAWGCSIFGSGDAKARDPGLS